MRRTSCGALLLGPLLVFLVIGGMGFFLLSRTVKDHLPEPDVPAAVAPSTTETLLLAFTNPRTPFDEVAALDLPGKKLRVLSPPTGWRLTSLVRAGLRIEELPVHDVYRLMREDGWNVVLRTSSGNPYQDPVILGFFDKDHVGVLAHTDQRFLLSVSRFGDIHVVTTLGENDSVRLVQDGFAWIVSFTPQEGIENEQRGPSTLTRITSSSVSSTVAESPGTIARVVPFFSHPDTFAYATEEGTLTAISGKLHWQGTGIPLVWKDTITLVFSQGKGLYQRDATTSTSEKITDLAVIPSAAFVSSTSQGLW